MPAPASGTTNRPSLAAPAPAVWGFVGAPIYATGDQMAPNGVPYKPLLALDSDFNLGLLSNKELYLFSESRLWTQRPAGRSGFGLRDLDAHLGVAWGYLDGLEFRASAYAFSNLDRGLDPNKPFGFKDGFEVENRYYFGSADIYDVGRLSFIGLGYRPTKDLVGGNGQGFSAGAFAHAYLTQDLPVPWFPTYAYGDLRLDAERPATPRLLETDLGVAVRPFSGMPNLELRVGYDRTDDVRVNVARNLVYGAVRLAFGGAGSGAPPATSPSSGDLTGTSDRSPGLTASPAVWGVFGLPFYVTGDRVAPNGAGFDPLFTVTSDLNLGLLENKELYLFWKSSFWTQRATQGITNSNQGMWDFSKRELDNDLGLAWGYAPALELRASAYALDNLNRGTSLDKSSGAAYGVKLENRYYFDSPDAYDVGRLSFVSIGEIPTHNLIGSTGQSFHPGLFARAYVTRDLPLSWLPPSYAYAGLKLTDQNLVTPRLLEGEAGLAIRPFPRKQDIEFRVGYDRSYDIRAGAGVDLLYGAIRINY